MKNVDPEGAMADPELVEELTRLFGGQILDNAVKVRDVRRTEKPGEKPRSSPVGGLGVDLPEIPRQEPTPYGVSPPVVVQGKCIPAPPWDTGRAEEGVPF